MATYQKNARNLFPGTIERHGLLFRQQCRERNHLAARKTLQEENRYNPPTNALINKPNGHPGTQKERTKSSFPRPLLLQARDLLLDTSQVLGNFKKPGSEGYPENPARFKFRPTASCWPEEKLGL